MPDIYKYKIGSITIALNAKTSSGSFEDAKQFDRFLTQTTPNIRLEVHCQSTLEGLADGLNGHKIFDTEVNWYLSQVGDKKALFQRSADNNPARMGFFSPDFHSGEIFVRAIDESPDLFYFPLSSPMGKVFMINLLAQGYGVLLHACGVIENGKGLIFAGFSGTGKTTVSKLWDRESGARVINDDTLILQKVNGRYWVYGTPWHGQGGFALPDGAPLDKILILKQANKNHASQLTPGEATTSLLARSFPPYWDAGGMDFTLGFLADLSRSLPSYVLGFVPEKSLPEYVRRL